MIKPCSQCLAGLPGKESGGVVELYRVPQITLHAFCDTPEMIDTMEKAVRRSANVASPCKVHAGGIAAAIDLYRQKVSPNLVVIESQAAGGRPSRAARRTRRRLRIGHEVIVIGYANDIALYRELLAPRGERYIVAPVDPLAIDRRRFPALSGRPGQEDRAEPCFHRREGRRGPSTIAHNVASTMGADLRLRRHSRRPGSAVRQSRALAST